MERLLGNSFCFCSFNSYNEHLLIFISTLKVDGGVAGHRAKATGRFESVLNRMDANNQIKILTTLYNWATSANGNTSRLHREVRSSSLLLSTEYPVVLQQNAICTISYDLETQNSKTVGVLKAGAIEKYQLVYRNTK
jgi:hypothetical protein